MYTGVPVNPKLKYKYELRIDRDYFEKNFVNTGTRKGYSEFVTKKPQMISTKFLRQVATLTVQSSGSRSTGGSVKP